jgi:hypothetical protein
VIGGLARRLRRARGVWYETCLQDVIEYHATRGGVDSASLVALLRELGFEPQVRRYFSTHSAVFQRLGATLGAENTFAIIAPRRELGDGIPHVRADVRVDHQDDARFFARSDERVIRPLGRMKEIPGSETSLLALDKQATLTGQNEERLLIRLSVVNAALSGFEDRQVRREPLGLAHVDDEPTLRDGGKPGASILKRRFVHNRILPER